ncbi:hypothetical protein Tco_1032781 [Tanacetum coccineum]|uniref:Uncharacterized protein n=1 Tax=Tanacetum coccineum TaxID=301880 RepID=A0ABQ5GDD8_9ASTR
MLCLHAGRKLDSEFSEEENKLRWLILKRNHYQSKLVIDMKDYSASTFQSSSDDQPNLYSSQSLRASGQKDSQENWSWVPKAVSTHINSFSDSSNSMTISCYGALMDTLSLKPVPEEGLQGVSTCSRLSVKNPREENGLSVTSKLKRLLMEAKEKGDVLDAEAEAILAEWNAPHLMNQPPGH